MSAPDYVPLPWHYVGLPWLAGGRSRAGVDCAGLAWLWLTENTSFKAPAPRQAKTLGASDFPFRFGLPDEGSAVFFMHVPSSEIRHVAIYLGRGKYLHILNGHHSRIDNGLTLLSRLDLTPVGWLPPQEAEALTKALALPQLGWTAIIVSIVLMALSYGIQSALAPSQQAFNNKNGRYGADALITQRNPEIPLPDVLGSVVVAGNAVYQQLPNPAEIGNAPTTAAWNSIVVLASAPVYHINAEDAFLIKGRSYKDTYWNAVDTIGGIVIDPAQTKSAAVTGNLQGQSSGVPSISLYDGAHAIAVPVDIRAQYDRDFPIYGLSGCSFFILRAVDTTKFNSLNFTVRLDCRLCRTFDTDGFISTSVSGESLTGASGTKVRFKLANADIIAVSSVTVNGTDYTQISASNQSGNIFHLNQTKGFIEFVTAPANAATILISYTYYPRAWTQNPASLVVYLLTEPRRGKGFDESRIDWTSAVDYRDYCDEVIDWVSANGTVSAPRFTANYAVDDRKPIQDHLRALLDASNALLFFAGGKFFFKARKGDDASVFSFDATNILLNDSGDSTFEAQLIDRTSKINRVKLLFHSDASLQAENEVIIDDEDNQEARAPRVGNNGVVDDNLKFPAVADVAQAERLADMILHEQIGSNWLYTWSTNIQGLPLQPGDVVDVSHDSLPTSAKNLRIEQLEYDENDHLKLTASEFVPAAYI